MKHKKPQLSYLNHLRPLNAITANSSVLPTPETLINATAENNQQEQALFLTEVEVNELETSAELNDSPSTERIMLQLQLMDKIKLKRDQKILEL